MVYKKKTMQELSSSEVTNIPSEKESRPDIKYLDDKEFKELNDFGTDAGYLQYVLGLQSCKSKGDVVSMLKEISEKARNQTLDEVKNIIYNCNEESDNYEDWIIKLTFQIAEMREGKK